MIDLSQLTTERIQTETGQAVLILRFPVADFELEGAIEFDQWLTLNESTFKASDYDRLVIDLSKVEFINSSGIGCLLLLHKKVIPRKVTLFTDSPRIRRVLDIYGLQLVQAFTICFTEQEALQ